MSTFYDEWLAAGDQIDQELRRTMFVARDRDIPWVRTRQDAKCKLMISNEIGYATMVHSTDLVQQRVGAERVRCSRPGTRWQASPGCPERHRRHRDAGIARGLGCHAAGPLRAARHPHQSVDW